MKLSGKEHYDVLAQFEKEFRGERLDREPKRLWPLGRVYQDGRVNDLFLSYRRGYALAKALHA